MAAIGDIHAVYVFPEADLRAQFDQRTTLQKVGDAALGLIRSLGYTLTYLWNSFWIPATNYDTCGVDKEWREDSQGLCVFLHGLRGHPSIWDSHRREMPDQMDCFIPHIPQRGNCSIGDAAAPILPTLLDYAQRHPGRPICLFGVSRGGPVALLLETQLREQAHHTPVRITTIAGVHYGTPIVDRLERVRLTSLFISQPLAQEFRFGNARSQVLLDRVRAQTEEVRAYDFSVSTEDFFFPELRAALPLLDKGESRHVIHGHSHDSIVAALAHDQMAAAEAWRRALR